jgi:hypothetical protein
VSRDELDELAAKLFEAAREEPLSPGAVERAVKAAARARAEPLPRPRWPAWSAVALAAGVALALWRLSGDEHGLTIVAEPRSAVAERHAPEPAPALPASTHERVSAPSAAPLTARAPTAPSRAPASAAASMPPPATLAGELEALKRAETALRAGDAAAALTALDDYDHVLHGSKLRAEAALLRMDALKRSGHAERAAELAQRFVTENPGSPLVDRARSFLRQPAPSTSAAPPPPAP